MRRPAEDAREGGSLRLQISEGGELVEPLIAFVISQKRELS